MLWINGKMTDLTKKDAIHKLVDAKCFLERYSNPHDKWTEAINIGIEAIEIVMDQEEQGPTVEAISKADYEARLKENNELINDLEELRTMINKFAESYENRLKADLITMLVALQLQFASRHCKDMRDCWWLIEDKINALKAESEADNGNDD